MKQRIHLLISGEDKARYESQAAQEGVSLGAWLREAAEERYRTARDCEPFSDPSQLEEFFAACDAAEGDGREPDWETHREILAESRVSGLPGV